MLGRPADGPLRVLALGAHPDDIEIGAVGTIMRLLKERSDVSIGWAVLSGNDQRAAEAAASAESVLDGRGQIDIASFRDGYFPGQFTAVKDHLFALDERFSPSVILVSRRDDLHQDHRLLGELAWQVFRDRLILEYEIPKWDGDLGPVQAYVELDHTTCERKVDHLIDRFPSQREKSWFTPDSFWAALRLRGIESGGASGFAEAFVMRKGSIGF
jgi:LmbE family N-acetylglucosaminyl deacetylase